MSTATMFIKLLGCSKFVRSLAMAVGRAVASNWLATTVVELLCPVVERVWEYYKAYRVFDSDSDADTLVFAEDPDEAWLGLVAPAILDQMKKTSNGIYALSRDSVATLRAETRVHGHKARFAVHKNDQDFQLKVNGVDVGTIRNITERKGRRVQRSELLMNITSSAETSPAVIFDTRSSSRSSLMYVYRRSQDGANAEGHASPTGDSGPPVRRRTGDAGRPPVPRATPVPRMGSGEVSLPRRRNSYFISEVPSAGKYSDGSVAGFSNQQRRNSYVISKVRPASPMPKDKLRRSIGVEESSSVVAGAIDDPDDDSVIYVSSHRLTDHIRTE